MKFLATLCFVAFHTGTLCCVPEKSCKGVPPQLLLWISHTAPWNFSEGPVRACNEFSAPTIGTALSVRQRKWRCGKTPVSMRGGNIQQMEWWHFMVKPPLPRSKIKDCTFEDGLQVVILNSHFPVTANGSFRSCRCFMKFLRHGPATNSLLTRRRMLKVWISSPCPRENRVFGFTAPSHLIMAALVNPWPASSTRYVSSLTWERFVRKVPARNFQLTAS